MRTKAPRSLRGPYLARWSRVKPAYFRRDDNAVVMFDNDSQGNSTKPWLSRTRGWKAFGPGPDPNNFLCYYRRKEGFPDTKVARKWRTAKMAMAAVDAEHPPGLVIRRTPTRPARVPQMELPIPATASL